MPETTTERQWTRLDTTFVCPGCANVTDVSWVSCSECGYQIGFSYPGGLETMPSVGDMTDPTSPAYIEHLTNAFGEGMFDNVDLPAFTRAVIAAVRASEVSQ